MRKFVDLHLICSPGEDEANKRLIAQSVELGYRILGISIPLPHSQKNYEKLRDLCTKTGMDFVSRLDLSPNSPRVLIRNLRRYRYKFEVISVTCLSKAVARQAAKDHRGPCQLA